MIWPWNRREPSAIERLLAVMERRAIEEQEAHETDRDVMLDELRSRLMNEEIDDPETRRKVEARISIAETHGWQPRGL